MAPQFPSASCRGAHVRGAPESAPRPPCTRASSPHCPRTSSPHHRTLHPRAQGPRLPSGTRARGSRQYFTVSHRRVRLLPCREHLQPQRFRVGGRERPSREKLLLCHEAQLHAAVQAHGDPGRDPGGGHGASASARALAAPSPRPGRLEKPPGKGAELGSASHFPHLRCKFSLRSLGDARCLLGHLPAPPHPCPLPGAHGHPEPPPHATAQRTRKWAQLPSGGRS